MKPISPDEVGKQQRANVPDEVLEAFNELIALNYVNGTATVRQDDVVGRIIKKMGDRPSSAEVFEKGWLNVEELYRAEGWTVTYDKPGYNESYPATYEFRKGGR